MQVTAYDTVNDLKRIKGRYRADLARNYNNECFVSVPINVRRGLSEKVDKLAKIFSAQASWRLSHGVSAYV